MYNVEDEAARSLALAYVRSFGNKLSATVTTVLILINDSSKITKTLFLLFSYFGALAELKAQDLCLLEISSKQVIRIKKQLGVVGCLVPKSTP